MFDLPPSFTGLFGVQLAAGMVIFLPWLFAVGKDFVRLMGVLAFVLVFAIGATQLQRPEAALAWDAPGALAAASLIAFGVALLLQQGGLSVDVPWLTKGTSWLTAVVALVASAAYFRLFLLGTGPGWHDGLRMAGMFASLGVLGAVITAMVLGHWYLVNLNLAIDPFRLMALVLIGALALRAVVSGAAFAMMPEPSRYAMAHLIELLPRLLFGIAVPLVIAAMTAHVIGLRNKQAATGLLYAAIVPILVGEALGGYLFLTTRVPV